jgi:1-phosphofructokinase
VIVTVTPNPSIDRTMTLPTALVRGAVHRIGATSSEPGGKGVNVARALALAGLDVIAVLPAAEHDPILAALRAIEVNVHAVPVTGAVRTNLALTESDGTTTKLNEPGSVMEPADIAALTRAVLECARSAQWVVLSGSLPPGMPEGWYADMVAALRPYRSKVAVDTSDAPLAALAHQLDRAAPDLIKPNAEELAGLAGVTAQSLESAVARGDTGPVVTAAQHLIDRGVGAVLTTLGAAGAVLVTADGAWLATPPPITPRSTVGAGDSALAGYVRADIGGAGAAQCLAMAVAYGSGAAALPGTALPSPSQLNLDDVTITAVHAPNADPDPDPDPDPDTQANP